jgi:hypothetical protein
VGSGQRAEGNSSSFMPDGAICRMRTDLKEGDSNSGVSLDYLESLYYYGMGLGIEILILNFFLSKKFPIGYNL